MCLSSTVELEPNEFSSFCRVKCLFIFSRKSCSEKKKQKAKNIIHSTEIESGIDVCLRLARNQKFTLCRHHCVVAQIAPFAFCDVCALCDDTAVKAFGCEIVS